MKIKFAAGNPKKIYGFISNINKNDKIALISHIDLDGLTAAKITNEILNAKNIFFLDYSELNEDLISKLKGLKINKVVFTDLNFSNPDIIKGIEKFADILIIDHHLITQDLNSDKTVFINVQGLCTGYLCYYFFSKLKNLDKWDWLVACSNVSDWLFMNNKKWLTKIYSKYNDKFNPDEIKKGKFWDLQHKLSLLIIYFRKDLLKAYSLIKESISDLKIDSYANEIQNAIDELVKKFKKEKQKIYDGYFWEIKSKSGKKQYGLKQIGINKLSFDEPDKTFIIIVKSGKYYKISSRRQDKKYNMAKLMQDLTKGYGVNAGGHVAAAGAVIYAEDLSKFKKRLKGYKYENN